MSKKSLSGKIIGGIILIVAVTAVIVFKPKPNVEPQDHTVRPIKTIIVNDTFKDYDLYFPGIVSADSKVDLSFNVPGQIIKKPHSKGDSVKKG
jgi:multidrug efflux pump subunit AcrA (membrane-fusion protein)